MGSIFDAAQSGLGVAALRLSTSAHNVANALTSGFVPARVAAEERPEGGASGRVVEENDPLVESRLDAAALGYGTGSGTDLATELVSQMTAAASYRANLASLRAQEELLSALVSLRS